LERLHSEYSYCSGQKMLNIVHKNQATRLLWDGGQNARAQTAIVMVATLLNTPANFSERALGDRDHIIS